MQATQNNSIYTTAEIADKVGVHKDTILRWLRSGAISEPSRDGRGWRKFNEDELISIKEYATSSINVREEKSKDLTDKNVIKRLEAIDWDFNKAKTQYLTHGLHPYPAKYIPQIPNALIQELSSVGDTVLDIFSGSGTTIVEALLLKRNAIGVDANPLAVMIGEAKTTAFTNGEQLELNTLVARAEDYASQLAGEEPNLLAENGFKSTGFRPDHKATYFWFEDFVVEELAEIKSWCDSLTHESSKIIAITAFSSIIVTVSKQDSDTRYVRREKNIKPGDTFKKFARALHSSIFAAEELTDLVEDRFERRFICSSLLENPDVGEVDLVVCSPPYPNAYSYHLYHMTRMVWLGMDQPKFKKEEIGSHRKYSSKSANAATVETFYSEMSQIFRWLFNHLKSGGYACFVVGDSTIRGEKIDNTSLLSDAACSEGFVEVTRIDRTIQKTKKSFNPKIGKIKKEYILVLRKK